MVASLSKKVQVISWKQKGGSAGQPMQRADACFSKDKFV